MKKMIPVLLSALLAVQAATAATTPVELRGIRPVIPRESKFSKVKYRVETGPGAEDPEGPQNLTPEQMQRMAVFFAPDPKKVPKNFSPALVYRMMDVMGKVDMHYKRPITHAEWDQRIQEMQDDFVKQNGRPGSVEKSAEDWEKAVDGMLAGFVKKLGDPHTQYMDRRKAKEFQESMQGSFVGIGVEVDKVEDGVKLVTVFPGSPAEKAGLIDGDVITAVDGVPTKDQDLQTSIDRLRGPQGTEVKVRIKRLGRPLTIVRGAFKKPELFGKMVAPDIGYVYFGTFGSSTDASVFAKIDELRAMGARKLILDLRGNPGGFLSGAQSISSEFLNDKDVVALTKRQGMLATKAVTDGPGRYYGMPLVIILNGYSASASEVLAAGLQEHGKARVVGSVSYGKGSFQAPMPTQIPVFVPERGFAGFAPDGTMIKVTEGGWYTPGDRSVEGVHDPATDRNIPGSGGVKPDEPVAMTEAEEIAAMKSIGRQLFGRPAGPVKDAALDKAIEVLNRP